MSDSKEFKAFLCRTTVERIDGGSRPRARTCGCEANHSVKSLSNLMELAGIWVTLLVFGQIVMAFILAERIATFVFLPWQGAVCVLIAVSVAMDTIAYLLFRGQPLSRWLAPALGLAGIAVLSGGMAFFV